MAQYIRTSQVRIEHVPIAISIIMAHAPSTAMKPVVCQDDVKVALASLDNNIRRIEHVYTMCLDRLETSGWALRHKAVIEKLSHDAARYVDMLRDQRSSAPPTFLTNSGIRANSNAKAASLEKRAFEMCGGYSAVEIANRFGYPAINGLAAEAQSSVTAALSKEMRALNALNLEPSASSSSRQRLQRGSKRSSSAETSRSLRATHLDDEPCIRCDDGDINKASDDDDIQLVHTTDYSKFAKVRELADYSSRIKEYR